MNFIVLNEHFVMKDYKFFDIKLKKTVLSLEIIQKYSLYSQ